MSLTIKSIETSGAALAALCVAGMSSHANATTVTVDFNYTFFSDVNSPVAIDSATPQFYYDSQGLFKQTLFGTQNSGMFATSGLGGSAQINPALTYIPNPDGVSVADKGGLHNGYVQLSFLTDSSVREYGFATVTDGDLVSVTYDDITPNATPLPAAWALFISGAGMLGLVAARRRRKAAA